MTTANVFKKLVLYLFFGALLATPLVIRHLSYGRVPTLGVEQKQEALRRFGFYLTEVAGTTGISFSHKPPRLDPKLDHILPQIASMGAAISVVDFDRDGWQDLYITNSGEGTSNALYRNRGDGTFIDVAAELGIADVNDNQAGVSMGSVWGDYDNDGYEDLFLYRWGRPQLFHNDAGKGFTPVTQGTGFPDHVNANTAIWFDYDRDGWLDLFLGGYFREDIDLWNLKTTRIMPSSFEYAQNGGRKYLFRNQGNGTFKEVSAELGIRSNRWSLAAVAADLRGTGYPDLFIANDYGVAELFVNENGKRFTESGSTTGVGFAPKSGMSVSLGDILNQGRFSVYVSNITEEGILIQGNNLWVPRPSTDSTNLEYENLARAMGVELGGWSWGSQFGDLNNDGFTDLYLTNGYISAEKGTSYWYDYTKITGGNETIISDAKNWPAMDGRTLAGYQQKRVWINDGAGHFQEVAQVTGATDTYDGRSVVMADLWNRGQLDVVVANQKGPVLVYKNNTRPENRWISFELSGSRSNRSAIGAQVKIYWNGMQQVQEVLGGSGFCAQNQRRLHFGLGTASRIDRIEIRWPSGQKQILNDLPVNQLHKIIEPA